MAIEPIDVANMALGVLDEASIDSLDQDIKAARLINLHYDATREAELAKHAWVFSILRATVDGADTGTGCGTLEWAYELPADCLRPLPLTHNGQPEPFGIPINWRQEADIIYSDTSGPLVIRYIANLTDPNDWTALFTDVVAAALAVKVALPLTHKASAVQMAREAYGDALGAAQTANAFERGGNADIKSWALQRGDYRGWR